MTSTIALLGKSGSGKTTLVRAFAKLIKENFSQSTLLLVDCDLTLELSDSYGIKAKNTIYGVKSGKHEYKTGVPEGISKQEFIEWALEDIIIEADENVDMIASWLVTPKDCNCISTKLTRDAMVKLIERYDFVVFDCEYDLKYLNSLVDYPITEAIIVSKADKKSIELSAKISQSCAKYASDGQLGVVLNKTTKDQKSQAVELSQNLDLNLIGCIDKFEDDTDEKVFSELKNLYSRLNLPQINN